MHLRRRKQEFRRTGTRLNHIAHLAGTLASVILIVLAGIGPLAPYLNASVAASPELTPDFDVARMQSGSGYRVFATREGLVGAWLDVEMLWQTGQSPTTAAQGCGHQLGGGGGGVPAWTPTPSPPIIIWGTARVSGTGGSGLNCRTAPSGSGTVITTLAENATVSLRGPAESGWYPVV